MAGWVVVGLGTHIGVLIKVKATFTQNKPKSVPVQPGVARAFLLLDQDLAQSLV